MVEQVVQQVEHLVKTQLSKFIVVQQENYNDPSQFQQEPAAPAVAAAGPLELAEGATGAGSGAGVGAVGGGGGQNQSPSLQRREEKKERRAAKAEQGRDEQVGADCKRELLIVVFLQTM